tara:strand:- start:5388 stop:6029 length:642 start_codon:yes stop_codon:yes gene_type:complete
MFSMALLAMGCGITVDMRNQGATVVAPMDVEKVAIPLVVVLDEVPDIMSTAGNEGQAKVVEVREIRAYLKRTFASVMGRYFDQVIVQGTEPVPSGRFLRMRVRFDAIGTDAQQHVAYATSARGGSGMAIGGTITPWLTWALAINDSETGEELFSAAAQTISTSSYGVRGGAPPAFVRCFQLFHQEVLDGMNEQQFWARFADPGETVGSAPVEP